MFTTTHWGNIRYPGQSGGGGGGGGTVDLTPIENRLKVLEATDVNHQVTLDDLGLQLLLLNQKVDGDTGSGGDDPGILAKVELVQSQMNLLQADYNNFQFNMSADFTQLAKDTIPDIIKLKETVFDKTTYPQGPGLVTKFNALQTQVVNDVVPKVTGLQTTTTDHGTRIGSLETTVTNEVVPNVTALQGTTTDHNNRIGSLEGFRGQQGALNAQWDETIMDMEFEVGHIAGNMNQAKADIVAIKAQLAKPSPDVSWDVFAQTQVEWNQTKDNQVQALDNFRTEQLAWKEEQQMTNMTFMGDIAQAAQRAEEAHTRITGYHAIVGD